MTNENEIATIFEAGAEERLEAINNLLKGQTPINEVKERPGRGGERWNYVNIYYMTRQIALITGFRWKSECLQEKTYPADSLTPDEVGAQMKVTIWDKDNREYSHTSWGQKEVSYSSKSGTRKPIAFFDDWKAAYSDGIKKCLSYFGIASDIYGGKELEYFADDNTVENMSSGQAYREFSKFLSNKKITVSRACEILKVAKLADIEDYKKAHDDLVAAIKV